MRHFDIPCLVFKQRETAESPKLAVFFANAKDIRSWAAIRRREEEEQGNQRRLSKAKINAIKRFFSLDPRNIIPPAIVVTLDAPAGTLQPLNLGRPNTDSLHMLSFNVPDGTEPQDLPGIVIDGQHRLMGLSELDADCPIPVVALLNVDATETAFQFLVINNKVTRVASDLIRTLALDYAQGELQERLKNARLTLSDNLRYVAIMNDDEQSPFRGHIALVTHEGDGADRFVAPAAIENAIALIQREDVPELKNDDALCDFFYAIWEPIKERWPDLWADGSKLMHKVSILATTSYFSELLFRSFDLGDLDVSDAEAVKATVNHILDTQTPDFWTCNWSMAISDTSSVRERIHDALRRISRNIRADRPWQEDVDMVSL